MIFSIALLAGKTVSKTRFLRARLVSDLLCTILSKRKKGHPGLISTLEMPSVKKWFLATVL